MKTSLAFVGLSLILASHLASCVPSQQQIPSSNEQPSSLGQDSFDAYSSSGLVFGLVGRPISANNNKRARKMSAFVPMRGRKDGRDEPTAGRLGGGQLAAINQLLGEQPMRESDGQEATISRLLADSKGWPSTAAATAADTQNGWPLQLAPRQFANQFAIQHLLGGGGGGQQERPLDGLPPQWSPNEQLGADQGGQMMQAKWRRAFHPMRGKKSSSPPQSRVAEQVDSDSSSPSVRFAATLNELFNNSPGED